ncbi:lycopene cyclase domain-containing protein [Cytophagales bacterium LB-30]|uniref:Lycopene cyclase domain-containing protein n=1 Tax=Shiella aurantiaca TaxID=3058365 RepID=A0ABT8F4X7_9BACT|nr:lycopene cyclase domain-containing protein [Shiella aurantiaca]MDN4165522.1 lycopene cyclase domain-containing protein [Shiella aurantiaca]
MKTYLLLNIGTVIFPLLLSFDKKVHYVGKWKNLSLAILLTLIVFVVWDVFFTYYGIWSFNEEHLIGVNIINLPLEEWLFFITVPFASVFIYECLKAYFPKLEFAKPALTISRFLIPFFLMLGVLNWGQWYTSINFLVAAVTLYLHVQYFNSEYLSKFYLAYLIHLIPFGLVNGVLTALPVVIYNDAENYGIRLGTIPLEDTVYSFTLLLMNISFFEYFTSKQKASATQTTPS